MCTLGRMHAVQWNLYVLRHHWDHGKLFCVWRYSFSKGLNVHTYTYMSIHKFQWDRVMVSVSFDRDFTVTVIHIHIMASKLSFWLSYLPWSCMLVSFLCGCVSLSRVDQICHEIVCLFCSFVDVRACFEWAVSATELYACLVPWWMWEPVSNGPYLPRSCMLVSYLGGCESLFRMGRICHGVVCLSRTFVDVRACFEWAVSATELYACLVPSWMWEPVSNGPYLPRSCMLVSFLGGCESLFRMGRICHGVVCLSRSFVDVRACFEWAVSATELYACLVPSWMWEPVSNGPYLPRSCMLVSFLRGCESLFRMGRICHGVVCLSRSFVDVRACFEWAVSATELYACLVPSWMWEPVSNGPYLPRSCMLVSFLRGCESLFRMGRICHGVVCLSRSFVDVRACFEWAVSATELYACLVPSWMWEPVSNGPYLPRSCMLVSFLRGCESVSRNQYNDT